MQSISLLIKPASSLCNLRCQYCFYHDVSEHRLIPSYGMMPVERLEAIVRQAFAESDGPVTFAFQGGEPTLAGLDFYQRLVSFAKKYNVKSKPVHFALQTNGQVINEEWADFLSEHRFLVGLSLDGDKAIHDAMRQDANGKGSFNQVMRAVNYFRQSGVEFNILTVINSLVARHIEKIYRFYRKNNFDYLQFIPCLPPLGADPKDISFSLSAERYSQFLKKLFDLWANDFIQGQYVSIRYFDNLVRMIAGEQPELCGMNGSCSCQFVIESDGSVYPCDFYVTDEWRLGYVGDQSFEQLGTSEKAKSFLAQPGSRLDLCDKCEWLPLCRGGCRRDRELPGPGSDLGKNQFCEAYQTFFPYAWPRLRQLAMQYKSGQLPGQVNG